jgi:serine protease Do
MRVLILTAVVAAGAVLAAIPARAQTGMASAQSGLASAQLGFAWAQPMGQFQTDLSNLENNLRLAQWHGGPYLGVRLADIDSDRAKALKLDEERGVEVVKVEPDSPAESAGLKAGDVLLSYNGETILGAQQLGRLVSETPQGRKVKIQFWRDGRTQTTTAVVGEARWPKMAPGDLDVRMPGVNVMAPDIPDPLLVWKSPALGIECEPVSEQLAEYFGVKRGVLVRSVEKGSAAEKAGIKAGDVLTAVGDRPVTNTHDVVSGWRAQRRPGKSVTVALVREHKQLTLSLPEPENQE